VHFIVDHKQALQKHEHLKTQECVWLERNQGIILNLSCLVQLLIREWSKTGQPRNS